MIHEDALHVLSLELASIRYERLVKYLCGTRTDLDDAFVACQSKEDFDHLLDNQYNF